MKKAKWNPDTYFNAKKKRYEVNIASKGVLIYQHPESEELIVIGKAGEMALDEVASIFFQGITDEENAAAWNLWKIDLDSHQEEERTTWYLYWAIENPRTKELRLFYTDGERSFSFEPSPTKAFWYTTKNVVGLPNRRDRDKLVYGWVENAIGPAATYYDRIIQFNFNL